MHQKCYGCSASRFKSVMRDFRGFVAFLCFSEHGDQREPILPLRPPPFKMERLKFFHSKIMPRIYLDNASLIFKIERTGFFDKTNIGNRIQRKAPMR